MLERFGFIKGKQLCACPRRGRWQEGKNIVSLPYNWLLIVGEFHSIEGSYQIRHFKCTLYAHKPNLL
jgi:hypothetical protein